MHQIKGLTQDILYYAYVFPVKALLFELEDLAQIKLLPIVENQIGFPTDLSVTDIALLRERHDLTFGIKCAIMKKINVRRVQGTEAFFPWSEGPPEWADGS